LPGTLVHEIATAAVIIGGVTTVIANGNPLIPLDGYYALSDYLEIPNLRQRAFAYLLWMIKSKVLRLQVPEPPATEREKRAFVWYAVLASIYICSIFLLIYGIVSGWLQSLLGLAGTLLAFGLVLYLARGSLVGAWRSIKTAIREHRAQLKSRSLRYWVGASAFGLLLIGLVPWPITAKGALLVSPVLAGDVVAVEGGLVERVFALEGTRVPAGAPVVQLRSPTLEEEASVERWLTDSLDLLAQRYRATGAAGLSRATEAEADESRARLEGLRHRLAALTLRAPVEGVIATPRLEETAGRWLAPGKRFAVVLVTDSLDLRLAIHGSGAALVQPGQSARLISYANPADPLRASITAVAAAADSLGDRAVEARVRIPGTATWWRPGMNGEGRVTIRHSNVAGVLWWEIRSRIRRDLLL
jgi:putative peptide zinc metalloprotease protein